MRKAIAIADFLSEDNKDQMRDAAARAGFGIEFFEKAIEARGRLADAEVLYIGDDAYVLGKMPSLKWCHTAFAGIGPYAESGVFDSGEVKLTNSSGAYGRTISEHIIMVSLMLLRQMPAYDKLIKSRKWVDDLPIRSIADSKVVIVGTGDLGSSAAKLYKAVGAGEVIGFNRSGNGAVGFDAVHTMEEFDRMFMDENFSKSVDLLVLCAPGTPDSKGLLSRERIGRLSERTYIINVGRGILIDQDALIDALKSGKIAGAAPDVVYPEPLPKDHPLWDAPNCIFTPHISGNMSLTYTVDRTVDIFCENLRRYVSGDNLINLVDVRKGY